MSTFYQHVHKLWLFSLLAKHRSFKRAAAQAGLSQSALSQNLGALEGRLGQTLIIRSRGALRLTDEGERLASEVIPILRGLDALAPGARPEAHGSINLRLGVYESVALTFLPQPLRNLTTGDQNIHVHLRMARTSALYSLVREGEVDVALLDTPAPAPLESVPFARSRLGLYASAHQPIEGWKRPGVLKVGSLSYGRVGHPDYFERFLNFHRDHAAARGVELRTVVQSDSFETLRAMAAAGAIVSVLPEHVAQRTKGDLVELPVADRPDDCAGNHVLYLVSRKSSGRLRDVLKDQLRSVA